MQTVQKNVQAFMTHLDFPADAQAAFLDALNLIEKDHMATVWFKTLLSHYELHEKCSFPQMLAEITALGHELGIHEFVSQMLLFLALAEPLRLRYAERGIDEKIYWASMKDLAYKLEECRLVQGKIGSFVASWFRGFFDMTRFALGRLQFEIITTKKDFTVEGKPLPAGSKAINMHIPRTGGRLDHEQVKEAYRLAAEWFAEDFGDQPIVFTCSSWLLFPWNIEVLSPTSNLAAFYRDFEIVESGEYENYQETWRLFDCLYHGDPSAMPQDSSFRRAYVARMTEGKPTGWGRGFFRWPRA